VQGAHETLIKIERKWPLFKKSGAKTFVTTGQNNYALVLEFPVYRRDNITIRFPDVAPRKRNILNPSNVRKLLDSILKKNDSAGKA
jgi:hypothetical protein